MVWIASVPAVWMNVLHHLADYRRHAETYTALLRYGWLCDLQVAGWNKAQVRIGCTTVGCLLLWSFTPY